MENHERALYEEGYKYICGVDEAGRGPLAGPVYAAAVILNPRITIDGINDSKKLSEKKRDMLFDEITQKALCVSIGTCTVKEIDELNILVATMRAMDRAVKGLSITADFALVDGNSDPNLGIKTMTIIKGDAKCLSIAAASIIAKVARDRHMKQLHSTYPSYGFDIHKGYGTKAHITALIEHGPCPEHRESFLRSLPKWREARKNEK